MKTSLRFMTVLHLKPRSDKTEDLAQLRHSMTRKAARDSSAPLEPADKRCALIAPFMALGGWERRVNPLARKGRIFHLAWAMRLTVSTQELGKLHKQIQ